MIKKDLTNIKTYSSDQENKIRQEIVEFLKDCPIPEDQLMSNLGLFLNSKN